MVSCLDSLPPRRQPGPLLAPRGSAGWGSYHCPYCVLSTSTKHFFPRVSVGAGSLEAVQKTSMILSGVCSAGSPGSSSGPASRPGACCLGHRGCVYAAGTSVGVGSGESPSYFFGKAFSCPWSSEACEVCPRRCPLLGAGWKERGCSKTFIPHSLSVNNFVNRPLESTNLLAKKPY